MIWSTGITPSSFDLQYILFTNVSKLASSVPLLVAAPNAFIGSHFYPVFRKHASFEVTRHM
jgi:hypothetical protein